MQLWKSLAVSYKDKFILTIHAAILPLGVYQRDMKTFALMKLILDVYDGFSLNHLQVKTTQISLT